MKVLLACLFRAEITAALHLGTFGEWWAARAARRLGKLSGELSPDDYDADWGP